MPTLEGYKRAHSSAIDFIKLAGKKSSVRFEEFAMFLSRVAVFFLLFAGSLGKNHSACCCGVPGPQGPPGPPGHCTPSYADLDAVKRNIQHDIEKDLIQVAVTTISNASKQVCSLGQKVTDPAKCCRDIYECNPSASSGYYWIKTGDANDVTLKRMYCDMETKHCGVRGGWMRVANIDMTDDGNHCPKGFKEIRDSKRLCIKSVNTGCSSVVFKTHGKMYDRVCGRARGYSYGSTDAFGRHTGPKNIDSHYVDGLSITYGSPRKHLWTYAAGLKEIEAYVGDTCPCATNPGYSPPSFVGNDFYCESANQGHWEAQWYTHDPLWDGHGCPAGNNCCANPGLPWFCKTLPVVTTEDIEARLCLDQSPGDENVGLELSGYW